MTAINFTLQVDKNQSHRWPGFSPKGILTGFRGPWFSDSEPFWLCLHETERGKVGLLLFTRQCQLRTGATPRGALRAAQSTNHTDPVGPRTWPGTGHPSAHLGVTMGCGTYGSRGPWPAASEVGPLMAALSVLSSRQEEPCCFPGLGGSLE